MARLFFALYPDAAARASLAAVLPTDGARGRVIPADNLHVTLAFLGDVDATAADALRALQDAVPVPPFELCFERLVFWERARARVLVPEAVPPEAECLQAGIRRLLTGQGLSFDRRPWNPHVTLERRAAPAPTRPVTPIRIRFDDYVLMASETRPEGAVYRPLARWRLPPGDAV
ncbi:RNA 2',3'-cyclic phosphodiesterase [Aquisalimonas asiatica]|uniref:RNA 2',3'-cyclic phosphodiesterase n=1 Tax=Aquisalimonas asiatica TaxID=406100 RepID=A0A1H8PSR4_9GAMM|nr:RNA 2',3'-cyclic phosphodiesterase [Aquisalimonas asiatica]SEO44806.1 2'-5' RNA ligase [Aquisalimonas asiatica]